MDNNQDKYTNYTYNGDDNSTQSSTIKLDKNGYYNQNEQNTSSDYSNPYATQSNPYAAQNNAYDTQNNPYAAQSNPYNAQPQAQSGQRLIGLSIASMGCGIASLIFFWGYGTGLFFAIAALILRANYRKRNNKTDNKFSKAGFITSLIGLILGALILVIIIAFYVLMIAGATTAGVVEGMQYY